MAGQNQRKKAPDALRLVPLLPASLLVVLFLVIPGVVVAIISFRPGNSFKIGSIYSGQVTLQHYEALFTTGDLGAGLTRSVVYVGAVVIASTLLGLLTAILLQKPFAGRNVAQLLLLLPWAVPGVVVSILFLWMLNESYGVVNAVLVNLGIIPQQIGWLSDVKFAMTGVVMPTVWKTYPFVAMTLIAATKGIPVSLYEAASIDGANELQKFLFITLPSILPALVLAVIIVTLTSFKEFDFIYPLTGGGPVNSTETLAIRIYNEAFRFFHIENAAALGVVTTVIAGLIAAVGYRYLRKEYFR
jgi:multiple sugar transport system permease protein